MIDLRIRFDARRVRHALARAEPGLRSALRDGAMNAARAIASEARKLAPVDRGQLRRSIRGVVRSMGLGRAPEGVVVAMAAHVAPMEFGTAKRRQRGVTTRGRATEHFPPPKKLIGWVMRKFGVGPKKARGIAFAVARKIHQRGGLKPRRFLQRAMSRKRRSVESMMRHSVRVWRLRVFGI